jgi:hypothetical protein
MNLLNLTEDERLVMEILVNDSLEGIDSPLPLPTQRLDLKANEINGYAEPRRLDSEQRRRDVALVRRDSLTSDQKRYLAEMMLEKLAGLCLAKAMGLTGDKPGDVLTRAKQFLR